ncbi:MAG: hypothetical protein PUG18_00300 [Lachnospiraceae bacterium]|nr:hypothetical protein [Lachnospiraceae bacterium]
MQPGTSPGKKKKRKPLLIGGIVVVAGIVLLLIAAAISSEPPKDREVVYEGIEFRIPGEWKLAGNSSSADGLVFYTNRSKGSEMLEMVAIPDATSLLELLGADYLMDQVIEYIHDQTGGKALGTKKMTAAGYDTYLYKVTGASKDFRGNSVEGSYRVACILNSDNSELILLCEYDVTDGESEQKALTDLDYILESATATSKKNTY